jgi:hypothetical protein
VTIETGSGRRGKPLVDPQLRLLDIVGNLAAGLHVQSRRAVTLDSRPEQDPGLDSLSCADRLLRIERAQPAAVASGLR